MLTISTQAGLPEVAQHRDRSVIAADHLARGEPDHAAQPDPAYGCDGRPLCRHRDQADVPCTVGDEPLSATDNNERRDASGCMGVFSARRAKPIARWQGRYLAQGIAGLKRDASRLGRKRRWHPK
jgi:hypothetical protein